MPIKCQRVTKQEVGAKGPAPALADSSLGLEEPRGEVGISCILECWNVGGLLPVCALCFVVCGLWFVVCGRVPKFGSKINLSGKLVQEFTI